MKEFTIICENEVGVLSRITDTLKEKNINITDITSHVVGDKGIVTLSVADKDDYGALKALRKAGFTPLVEDGVVIKIKDKPGALAAAARKLKEAKIDIKTTHIVIREKNHAFVALTASNPKKMRKILKDYLI